MEAETKFRTLVEKSLVGVYIMQNGRYKYLNPAIGDILGYPLDEILDKMPIEKLIYPEDWKHVKKNIEARLSNKIDSIRYELRLQKKNGEIIWVEAFGSRIPYQG